MQRIGVLNGNNITYDHDLAGLVRGLTDGGVIQGGEITGNKVQPVQAVIACQRSNGQKLMLYFESDEQVSIPSSGTFKVYIEVNQAKIDDGTGNAENGTGIASIKTGPSVPSQNSLLLASVADGQIKDERNLIPKIQSVAQRTSSLEQKMETQEQKVEKLEEAGTIKNLADMIYLGENLGLGEWYTTQGGGAIEAKYIKIERWLAGKQKNGNSVYGLTKFSVLDENGIPIPKAEYVSPNIIIENTNGNSYGHTNNGFTTQFTSIKKISAIVVKYADSNLNDSYGLFTRPIIKISNNGSSWIDAVPSSFVSIPVIDNTNKTITIDLTKLQKKSYSQDEFQDFFSSKKVYAYKAITPNIANSTFMIPFGNSESSNQIHIQRLGSGKRSKVLKLKLGYVGQPTLNLIVEVRKGVLGYTDLSNNGVINKGSEAMGYWTGGELLAQKTLTPEEITQSGDEITVIFDQGFGGTKGELLNIVLYQEGGRFNAVSYYTVWGINTNNKAFGYNMIGGSNSSITSFTTPVFCLSDGFLDNALSKYPQQKSLKYLVDDAVNIGDPVKAIMLGDSNKGWYDSSAQEYQKGTIQEIAVSQSGEGKDMVAPSPGIVIFSVWTDYKAVACGVDNITILSLYNSNSGTLSQTVSVPVKGGERIRIRKLDYSGGASAKFISL